MKPLLVGELNPYGPDETFALYPSPRGSAGQRLAEFVMGLDRADYLRRFDRANLCTFKWSVPAARERAGELLQRDNPVLVLLGAKVAGAFGQIFEPFTVRRTALASRTLVVLPHPSGLCRVWNEPNAVARARAALRLAGVLP